MTKQTYCSKELCLKLEKKGIEASHVMQFEKGGGWYKKYTLDVVCKWLREVYDIHIGITPFDIEPRVSGSIVRYIPEIYTKPIKGHELCVEGLNVQDSYDEAVIAALNYTIDNLI